MQPNMREREQKKKQQRIYDLYKFELPSPLVQ